MKGGYMSVEVLCPFYLREEKQKVLCEGVEDGMGTHLTFETPEWKRLYKDRYCCNNYKTCRVYKMLEEKYE